MKLIFIALLALAFISSLMLVDWLHESPELLDPDVNSLREPQQSQCF